MTQWPATEKGTPLELWEEWRQYERAGGLLSYEEWLAAGMPSITTERANIAWMTRLDAYLTAQANQGFISESERDVIWNDMEARLLGRGKYKGEPHSTLDLPSSVRSDVERYWTGLPVAAKKEAEQAAREEQQKKEAIAAQRMQLPLGVRGTPEQQVTAAYNAIRQLKIQMGAAPDYLKSVMGSQIAQLEDAISQMKESIRTQARIQTAREQPLVEEERGPGMMAQQFAEKYGISPEAAAQTGERYWRETERLEGKMPEEFAGLTKEEVQDLAWVGMESAGGGLPQPAPPVPVEPPEFRELGVTGAPAWKRWFEMRYPSIARQFRQKPKGERTATGWSQYLETERKRIQEEFMKQSPYQRGERPGAFQPRIKTVGF